MQRDGRSVLYIARGLGAVGHVTARDEDDGGCNYPTHTVCELARCHFAMPCP